MKHSLALLSLMLGLSAVTYAQDAYVCIPTNGTGFKYSRQSKSWEVGKFNVRDEKRVLKREPGGGWRWRTYGKEYGSKCRDFNEDGYLRCQVLGGTVHINRDTLRYLETFEVGYFMGNDNDFTPGMVIGTCSPL